MAVEFERLVVYMDARLADYEKALAKAQSGTSSKLTAMERRFQQAEQKISGFGKAFFGGLIGALGVGLGAGGLTSAVRSALDLADNLADASKQLGITTTDLQTLQFGAREAGIEVEGLDSALDMLSKGIGEAATGDKTKLAQFAALGVDLKDAAGNARPLIDVLQDVAAAITNVGDRQQQTAALNDIFGRSGTRLLPLLQEISGGMDDLTAAAEEAGQVMSEETVKALGDAHDALEAFGVQVTIVVGGIVEEFMKVPGVVRDITLELANAKTVWDSMREAVASQVPLPMSEADATAFMKNFVTALGGGGGLSSPGLSGLGIIGSGGGGLSTGLGGVGNPYAIPGSSTYNPPRTGSGGGSGGAGKRAAEARDEALRQMAAELQLNAQLIASYGQGEAVLDGLRAAYQAVNEARKLGLEGDDLKKFLEDQQALELQRQQLDMLKEGAALTESLRTEEEERADVLDRLNQLREAGVITEETYNRALEDTNTTLAKQRDLAEDVVGTLFGGMLAAAQAGQGVKGVLDSITQSLNNIAGRLADKALSKFFDFALDAIFGTGGGVPLQTGSGGGFGGNVSMPSGRGVFPKMARGGRAYAGQPIIVGEERPELFVPDVPGTIIPRVGMGGGGTLVQVINNVPDTVMREERRQENGRETTRIYLDQATAKNMARSGTATRRTMETLGARQRLPSR